MKNEFRRNYAFWTAMGFAIVPFMAGSSIFLLFA